MLSLKEFDKAEKIFLAAMETVSEPIIIIDDGLIKYWNNAAEKIFGYSYEEVINKNVHLTIAPEHYHGACKKGFKTFKKTELVL